MAVEFLNVYCKLPNGLTMCLEVEGEVKRVTLPRSARYIQPHPNFKPTKDEFIVFGSTVTPVAKDFWDAWKKKMGPEYAPLKNGLVWAVEQAKKADGIARAREMETVTTGFEQIDPATFKDARGNALTKLDDRESPEE